MRPANTPHDWTHVSGRGARCNKEQGTAHSSEPSKNQFLAFPSISSSPLIRILRFYSEHIVFAVLYTIMRTVCLPARFFGLDPRCVCGDSRFSFFRFCFLFSFFSSPTRMDSNGHSQRSARRPNRNQPASPTIRQTLDHCPIPLSPTQPVHPPPSSSIHQPCPRRSVTSSRSKVSGTANRTARAASRSSAAGGAEQSESNRSPRRSDPLRSRALSSTRMAAVQVGAAEAEAAGR